MFNLVALECTKYIIDKKETKHIRIKKIK